jgi:hypothetical protein
VKYFVFILLVDLIGEATFVPWYVHVAVALLASYDVVVNRFKA